MFKIDPSSPMPIYAQLEQAIKLALISGKIKMGEQMPTVRQLAVALKINGNTVARVYTELERQRILETRRGIGTFVAARSDEQKLVDTTRDKALSEMVVRLLDEAAAGGFTAQEIIEVIQKLSDGQKREGK